MMATPYVLRRGGVSYLRPRISGPAALGAHTLTPTHITGWERGARGWRTTTGGTLSWGQMDCAQIDASARVDGPGVVDLIIRWQDASNHWWVRWDPATGSTSLWRMKGGTKLRIVESRRGFTRCQLLKVGTEGPVLVLYGPDGARVASTTDALAQAAGTVAVRAGAGVELQALTVAARTAEGYVWPGAWSAGTLDVQLGGSGAWDSADINNPNLAWDPITSKWTMNYTGYSGRKAFGVQDAGLATAATLDGPWTKHPSNPVLVDDSAGMWSQNGGYVRRADGTWLLAYSGANGTQAWFATATKPEGPWTKQTWGRFTASDPFLRLNGSTVECYYYRGIPFQFDTWNIYRRTSSDGGQTWGSETRILGPAPVHDLQGGEPSVIVPPGMEGRVMGVAVDYLPDGTRDGGRGTILAMTRDAGQTWAWHLLNRRSYQAGAWDQGAAFDSFMQYDATRKRLYNFFGGVPGNDNQTLGIGIQIGHKWAAWDPAGM